MKLKQKLSLIAAAVGIAFAGHASALALPSTNNGSLWLTVWDSSTGGTQSYTRDLGLNINTFLTNGLGGDKTPEAGLTLNFATDALFASTFASVSTSNLVWNVFAADNIAGGANGQARVITTAPTSTATTPTFSRNNTTNAGNNANFHATDLNNNWGCGTASSCAVNDPTAQGAGQSAGFWNTGIGGAIPFNTSAAVGSLLNFFYFAANSAGVGAADAKQVFANTTGRATWTLDGAGNATYQLAGVAAVPVPAAAWLLGSGLFGLVGVARRRKQEGLNAA